MSPDEIDLFIRTELALLGCRCAEADDLTVRAGETRGYGISKHQNDCPAVAHFSLPENQPR